jgi:hypothetical protein
MWHLQVARHLVLLIKVAVDDARPARQLKVLSLNRLVALSKLSLGMPLPAKKQQDMSLCSTTLHAPIQPTNNREE